MSPTPHLDALASAPAPDGRAPSWSIADKILAAAMLELRSEVTALALRMPVVDAALRPDVDRLRVSFEALADRLDAALGLTPASSIPASEIVTAVMKAVFTAVDQVLAEYPGASSISVGGS